MTTSDRVDMPTEVRYAIPRFAKPSKRAQYFIIGVNVLFTVVTLWQFWRGKLPLTPILFLLIAAYSWWRIHSRGRDAVATAEGISGPHLRRPIFWKDVESLAEPSRYDPEIFVILTDGSRKGTGFPPSYFEQLKPLANVPIKPYSVFE